MKSSQQLNEEIDDRIEEARKRGELPEPRPEPWTSKAPPPSRDVLNYPSAAARSVSEQRRILEENRKRADDAATAFSEAERKRRDASGFRYPSMSEIDQ